MPELGKYAATVLSAYGISLGLMAVLIGFSLWQSRVMKRRLDRTEERQRND